MIDRKKEQNDKWQQQSNKVLKNKKKNEKRILWKKENVTLKLWLEAYHAFYKEVFKGYKKCIHGIWSNFWLCSFLFYFLLCTSCPSQSTLSIKMNMLQTLHCACPVHFQYFQQEVISCQPHPKPLSFHSVICISYSYFPAPSNFGILSQIIFCSVFLLFLPKVPYHFD